MFSRHPGEPCRSPPDGIERADGPGASGFRPASCPITNPDIPRPQSRMRSLFYSLLGYFLTPAGIVAMGLLDSSLVFFLPLGIDFVVIIMAARKPELFWLYAVLATIGAMAGAAVTFWLGRKLGEKGLERIVSPSRLKRVQRRIGEARRLQHCGARHHSATLPVHRLRVVERGRQAGALEFLPHPRGRADVALRRRRRTRRALRAGHPRVDEVRDVPVDHRHLHRARGGWDDRLRRGGLAEHAQRGEQAKPALAGAPERSER